MMEFYNTRFALENKIRELEHENKEVIQQKQKFEIDYRVASEKINDNKGTIEQLKNENDFLRTKQTEEMNMIESRTDKLNDELERFKRENGNLRKTEEKLRAELQNMERQRDEYRDKYHEYKSQNTLTNSKVAEIEEELRKLMLDKQSEAYCLQKDEEMKQVKRENAGKIFMEMSNKLGAFKRERMQKKSVNRVDYQF